ncbi:MAG: C10 family peptidase [Bacteroidales bacterium]|nr:C10 family peptidase [Bacteroidales bacterium]
MNKTTFFSALSLLALVGCSQDGPLKDQKKEVQTDLSCPLLALPDTATVVESSRALDVATAVLAENESRSMRRIPEEVKTVNDEDGTPLYYVVNYLGGGFVVVSATRDYTPIIAYSNEGRFDLLSGNENGIALWMASEEENIRHASAQPDSVRLAFRQEWGRYNPNSQEIPSQGQSRTLDPSQTYDITYAVTEWQNQGYYVYTYENFQATPEYMGLTEGERTQMEQAYHFNEMYGFDPSETVFVRIKYNTQTTSRGPLLSTNWGQNYGYNKYIPGYNSSYPALRPTGCVAVAVGQIMKFHQKPTTYAWSSMPDNSASDITASLLYDVAEAVHTQYGDTASSSNYVYAQSALKNFGYSKAAYTSYTWAKTRDEVASGRPLYMRGTDSATNSGHAWVCDGYKVSTSSTEISLMAYVGEYYSMYGEYMENLWSKTIQGGSSSYLHHNWGWRGSYNGWFSSSNFNGGSYNFNTNMKIIYNIY